MQFLKTSWYVVMHDGRLKMQRVTPLLSAHVAICIPQPQCFLFQPSGKQNLQSNKPSCKHNKERSILVFPGEFYQKSSTKYIYNTESVNKMNSPPSQIPFFIYAHVEVFDTTQNNKMILRKLIVRFSFLTRAIKSRVYAYTT